MYESTLILAETTSPGGLKMSVREFGRLLHEARVGENARKWFPKWLRRYASMVEAAGGNLPVTEADVVRFSRSLRDNGTPAYPRGERG